MVITTELTETLGLRVPLVQGGMQWVGTPALASAVSNAGALGILTALTQPSPDALRQAIRETKKMLKPEVLKRGKYGPFGVNITLLPSINPPDYKGYCQAALDEGIRIFETAGNNPGEIIQLAKKHGAYVIHKCTAIRHAQSAQRAGADMLSIDGFECAGHPGEDDIGGLVLMARAAESLSIPFIASGGVANGRGLAASLVLGACGANMGTRFMCTKEAEIHDNVKRHIVQSDERDTIHIFRTLRNTARVFKNAVAKEVVALERRPGGAQFQDIQHLVSGARGRKVYENGDIDAGIWSAGITVGLIHDIPSCEELVRNIEREAEREISRLSTLSNKQAKL
ncbi:putative 2-Nitropropane dioxygenase [Tilletiaria anomala UBC 951]|uniref:Putative 2-Nitropropane dioxygenase n=1 Tax=Tilletiaria anomala (strain ATCC 24038 / CBS 436.72 / UBC 951) TaxID=1037660 RepID=A0A066WCB8_TILAU|nr:putative 2-Nitropropane dioxygenase [Tilletiaria anomala UBC 951]KDN51361.1 putative 2-Nitropropane dioxygenase [Tilletiaria anomala UBC 951]